MRQRTATDISAAVREEVYKRDSHCCIICGYPYVQIAHYVSRASGGLGTPENLVCLCQRCHNDYDNGNHHNEIKAIIERYLSSKYNDWSNANIIYHKR